MSHYTGSVPDTEPEWDWRVLAACRSHDDPDIWYATASSNDGRADLAEAKEICGTCPVQDLCWQWAVASREPYGMWGGMTEAARRKLLRIRVADGEIEPRRGGRPRAECGTSSAYDRHVKRGEPIDDACRAAHTASTAERRERAKHRASA